MCIHVKSSLSFAPHGPAHMCASTFQCHHLPLYNVSYSLAGSAQPTLHDVLLWFVLRFVLVDVPGCGCLWVVFVFSDLLSIGGWFLSPFCFRPWCVVHVVLLYDSCGNVRLALKQCHVFDYERVSDVSIWHSHTCSCQFLLWLICYSQLSMWSRVCICVCVLISLFLMCWIAAWRLRLFSSKSSRQDVILLVQAMYCFGVHFMIAFRCDAISSLILLCCSKLFFVFLLFAYPQSMSIAQNVLCHPHMFVVMGIQSTLRLVYLLGHMFMECSSCQQHFVCVMCGLCSRYVFILNACSSATHV